MVEITEIRIKLMESSEDRLRAFCSITIDQSFVVRDLKIIDGSHGPFVAMPSRKLTGHCNRCGSKNHLRASYCNQCGAKVHSSSHADSPQKLYADVAHPINSDCREMIQNAVINEFNAELQRSAQPNYRSRYDDDFDAGDYDDADYPDSSNLSSPESGAPPAASTAGSPSSDSPSPPSDFAAGLFAADELQRIDQEQSELDAPHRSGDVPPKKKSDPSSAERLSKDSAANRGDTPSTKKPGEQGTESRSDQRISSDRGASSDEDTRLVRSETGVQYTIPQPHFRDRPGGSRRQTVSKQPLSGGSGNVRRSAEAGKEDGPKDPGFGAGIFDD